MTQIKKKYAIWLVPLIFVIMLVLAIFVMGTLDNKRFDDGAIKTTARIVHIGNTINMQHTGKTTISIANVKYEYEVNGQTYLGDLHARLCEYEVLVEGAIVPIEYLKYEPSVSRCIAAKHKSTSRTEGFSWFKTLLVLVSIILVLAYCVRLYQIKVLGIHDPD